MSRYLELRRTTARLGASVASRTPIFSDVLLVWRMRYCRQQEHHLPQRSPEVRTESWVAAARAVSRRDAL